MTYNPSPPIIVVTATTPSTTGSTIQISSVGAPDATETHTFTFTGPLVAYTGLARLYLDVPCEIRSVRFTVGTTSVGATVVDVKCNGASIFSAVQNVAAGSQTTVVRSGFARTSLAMDDYLSVDIISASLTQPASDLTVTLRVRRLA